MEQQPCSYCPYSPTFLLFSIHKIRRRRWHPTPVLWPGESHGWRSLVVCSPWGHEESDTTECCFCFGFVSSFFLELFLHYLQEHIGHLPTWGVYLSVSYLFAFSYCSWGSQDKNTEVVCHSLLQCMQVKSESEVPQLFPTLSDPMDCRLPGSSIHGIFQARVLESGAIKVPCNWRVKLSVSFSNTGWN